MSATALVPLDSKGESMQDNFGSYTAMIYRGDAALASNTAVVSKPMHSTAYQVLFLATICVKTSLAFRCGHADTHTRPPTSCTVLTGQTI
jgi:hypothetical protein